MAAKGFSTHTQLLPIRLDSLGLSIEKELVVVIQEVGNWNPGRRLVIPHSISIYTLRLTPAIRPTSRCISPLLCLSQRSLSGILVISS